MDPMPEGQVRIRIARDIEPIRVAELLRVAISGTDHRNHELARRNDLPMQLDLAPRQPEHPLQRRAITQDFFDG